MGETFKSLKKKKKKLTIDVKDRKWNVDVRWRANSGALAQTHCDSMW